MPEAEPHRLSAAALARLIEAGELTAETVVRSCLDRIRERDPVVRAWAWLDPEQALVAARACDRGGRRGLLKGVPFGIKDIFDTSDMPAGYGSPIYSGCRPSFQASAAALPQSAGSILIGKTVTTEFANRHPGPTSHPKNPMHTPGGSSSGSAAAVADFMVPLAFGTQTAGSIIRPASYCGVVGYKPSFGLISRVGVKALSDTLDTVGTLARSVPDAAFLAAAVSGRRQLIIEQPWSGKLRIGICRTYEWKHALPETVAALESAAGKLGTAGAQVSEIKLPPTYANLVQAQCDIMFFEEVQSLAHERLSHAELLSKNLRALLDTGLAITHERYDAAQMLARNCRRTLGDVFADCDVLLAPSAPGAAPAGLNMTGDPVFNRTWTLLRTPCVTLPVATAKNGLPVGLQVIGAFGSDVETLAGAHWIHQALK